MKYITMKKTIEANKIRRMQAELHMIDAANQVQNKHTLFLDSDEEDIDLAKHFDTHPALLSRRTNRTRLSDLNKLQLTDHDVEVSKCVKF